MEDIENISIHRFVVHIKNKLKELKHLKRNTRSPYRFVLYKAQITAYNSMLRYIKSEVFGE